MKISELKKLKGAPSSAFFVAAGLALATACLCRAGDVNQYKPILYPSIFWHDNQWETYENGQWTPYRGSDDNEVAVEPEPEMAPEPVPGPEMGDTNIYPLPYGWGFIGAPAFSSRHRLHARAHLRPDRQRHETRANGIGRPNVGIGRTTIGIGRPNAGLGQTTVGIGRPNVGIGRPNVGMGQQNVGIAQTTISIGQPNADIGQQNSGIGRATIGIGQPNIGVGQNNTAVGQPNVGIGQPTIGIGQQVSSHQSGWGTQRGR